MRPCVLSIAGSDSSGGAGIQADLKTIAAHKAYGASVITAITAQNTRGVALAECVSLPLIQAQLAAVFDDMPIVAVKTGMLGNDDIINIVADAITHYRPRFVVCDPVMISKNGHRLLQSQNNAVLLQRLLPLSTIVTPNIAEAEALTGMVIESISDAIDAGKRLCDAGANAVLVKGGHLLQAPATDVLVTHDDITILQGEWQTQPYTHGTGCMLSAAIASQLALGVHLLPAIERAKKFVSQAIAHGYSVGAGISPPDPLYVST